jgi:hypothetical protein
VVLPSYVQKKRFGEGAPHQSIYCGLRHLWGLFKVKGIGSWQGCHLTKLVETLSYNLLSVAQLADMGFATFFDVGIMVLLWRRSRKVAFVGNVENGLYVIDFSKKFTKATTFLMAKVDVGWLWHRRLDHVNMRTL